MPSDAAWKRAVPAVLALRPGFLAPGAFFLPGASTNADVDIYQLQATQKVTEDAVNARFDFKLSDNWSTYVRVSHDQGTSDQPETVAGRVLHVENNPTNAVFNLQGVLSDRTLNEFKFGYNAAPTQVNGVLENPIINGIDFSSLIINTSGNVANSGIAGQGGSTGLAIPGGLVRANSSTNGRGQPYDPYTVSFVDALTHVPRQSQREVRRRIPRDSAWKPTGWAASPIRTRTSPASSRTRPRRSTTTWT